VLSVAKSVFRSTAKVIAFAAMGNGPWLRRRLEAVRNAGVTTILNLHRVAEDDGSDYKPLKPSLFEELLAFAKREFAIVTVSELGEATRRPKLVLSFDDGYRDFLTTAVPILRRHDVRANQNVIPQCIERGTPPLNVMAQDFVGQAPAELVRALRVPGFSAPVDGRYGHRLSHHLKMRSQVGQEAIAAKLLPQFQRFAEFKPTPMMSRDDVKGLADHEIGAHSFAHASMEFESDAYLDADVRRCGDYLRDKIGVPMTIYAFPNGSCSAGQAERVLAQGVDHVLLVGDRFDRNRPIHQRITFDARSRSEVRYKAAGGRAPL
jgi:peptidoglycan/xylan/chitin deacetylase (PgdA/CDA1 family)